MSLQGSWRFEENTGTTSIDTSGSGRTMTAIPGWTSSGHTGNAMALNGSQIGASVTVDNSFTRFDSSTFMCWVKFNSFGSLREVLYGPRYGSIGIWYMGVTAAGKPTAAWGDGSMTASTSLSTGTWYHMALAIDWNAGSGSQTLYINGSPVATGSTFPLNPGTLLWGGNKSAVDGDVPLDGIIDDARWYSEQMGQTTIQVLMNTPVPSLLAGSGTSRFALDSSGAWQPVRTQRNVNPPSTGSLYGWQLTADNTGLKRFGINGENLPLYNGLVKPAAGTTIFAKKITTPLDLSNGNITIERCFVQPTSVGQGLPVMFTYDFNGDHPGAGPVTIKDCTFDGSQLSQHNAAISSGIQAYGTITGNYVAGFGSGIAVFGVGDHDDCLIQGNYVTGLVAWGDPATDGNHSDGFTIRDFTAETVPSRQITVQNNRFDCDSGNDTGACFLQTYAGRIDNALIQGNLLEGGGYNMGLNELNAPYSNIRSINNRFNPTGYGASSLQGGDGYTEWTDNYINDPGQPDNKGVIVA